MMLRWMVRCEDTEHTGTADTIEAAQRSVIEATAAVVSEVFAGLAGRSAADLPAIAFAVDDAVAQLHVGLDVDGHVDAAATGATAYQLLAAHLPFQRPHPIA